MPHSESLKELAAALAKAQAAMKTASRDSENPHFRSRYADLASVWEACRGPLTANGLSVLQPASSDGSRVSVTTTLLHTSGEWIGETLTMTAKDAAPQSVGSALTYARRYGLAAMVGVCPDDDDGEAATDHAVPAARAEPSRPTQHQGNGQARAGGHDAKDRPSSGRALFAWAKAREEEHGPGIIKGINDYAKRCGFGGKMVEFGPEEVSACYHEALSLIRERAGHLVPDAGERG